MLGYGDLNVKISDLMLTGETFLIMREKKGTKKKDLYVKEMDLKITNQGQDLKLDNLIGGGFAGRVANYMLKLVADKLIFNKVYKDISKKTKMFFRKAVSKFLTVGETPPSRNESSSTTHAGNLLGNKVKPKRYSKSWG